MPPKVLLRHSSLATPAGEEIFLSVHVQGACSFVDAFTALQDGYATFRQDLGLGEDTEIWLRFFLSDVSTQTPWLNAHWSVSPTALLCPIGQPTASGDYVALLAHHIRSTSLHKEHARPDSLTFRHGGYTSTMANYLPSAKGNAKIQSDEIIAALLNDLCHQNAVLADDVIRTWYYIRDVDNNYLDMIASRREYYEAEGLRPDTHFIASTGIEALAPIPWVLSWMTVLTTLRLQPEQISYLKALDYLSPTHVYGVNFERATRVDFGDRAHIHLSGTASIDREGQVLHIGNVTKQCARTVENIAALLEEGRMNLKDMRYAIVYLRDPAECAHVSGAITEAIGDIPVVTVRGAVCRPDWLIEVEGLAGTAFSPEQVKPFPFYL